MLNAIERFVAWSYDTPRRIAATSLVVFVVLFAIGVSILFAVAGACHSG